MTFVNGSLLLTRRHEDCLLVHVLLYMWNWRFPCGRLLLNWRGAQSHWCGIPVLHGDLCAACFVSAAAPLSRVPVIISVSLVRGSGAALSGVGDLVERYRTIGTAGMGARRNESRGNRGRESEEPPRRSQSPPSPGPAAANPSETPAERSPVTTRTLTGP
jgi:hypothetical protein